MTAPILSARDVRKSYGRGANRFEALKGLGLDIPEGESLAIIGKSGSGKSTLMHLLALLDRPTAGTIMLAGTTPAPSRTGSTTPEQSLRVRVPAVLPDARRQRAGQRDAPAEDRRGLPAGADRPGIAALAQLELDDKAGNNDDLSGGQKQRWSSPGR